MRLTCFVVWKSWASNPLRTCLTVLGVALGVAVVTAIHVLDHNTIHTRLQQRRADYGRVDLELRARDPGNTEALRQRLVDHPQVRAVGLLYAGALGAAAELTKAADQPAGPVRIYGLHPQPSRDFALYTVAEGQDLSPLDGDGAALLGPGLAARHGLGVGDTFTLRPSAAQEILHCVDGKLVRRRSSAAEGAEVRVQVAGILSAQGLARRHAGLTLICSYALARRVSPGLPTWFQINRQPGASPELLKQELQPEFQVLDARSAMVGENMDERAFRNGIKIIGLLALVMGMLVVFQTLSQTLLERLKQIGLLRSLGASQRAVAGIFLGEGSLIGLLGSGLGLGLGLVIAYLLGEARMSTLGVGKEVLSFQVPARPLLLAVGLGLFFTLAGSAFPLWKARNLSPQRILSVRGLGGQPDLLRGVNVFLFLLLVLVLPGAYLAMTPLMTEAAREARHVFLQVGGLVGGFGALLLIVPGALGGVGRGLLACLPQRWILARFLCSKALIRNPGRFAAAVCGLAVVLVAILSLKFITWGLRGEVQQFSARCMDQHLFLDVEAGPPVDRARLDAIRRLPGVRRVEGFAPRPSLRFVLRGLPAARLAGPGELFEQDPALLQDYQEERSMVVSRRWAELHNKQAGQSVPILVDGKDRRYRILAVSDSHGFFPDERAWAICAPRWLQQDFCVPPDGIRRLSVAHDGSRSVGELRDAIRAHFPHSWFKTGESIRDYLIRDVTRDFVLFDMLLFLILAMVGMGLVNTMTIAALGRAREIGVLRALGMDDAQLRLTMLVEGLVVAVLSVGIALAAGLPLGYLLIFGLGKVAGMEVPYLIPWPYLLVLPLLGVATGLLASWLPASRALRIQPGDAIRYE